MSDTLTEVARQANQLPAQDRARLAEMMLESLQEPAIAEIEAEWNIEIAKRLSAWQNGETTIHAAEDVLAEAKAL